MRRTIVLLAVIVGMWGLASMSAKDQKFSIGAVHFEINKKGKITIWADGNGSPMWKINGVNFDTLNNRIVGSCEGKP